MCLPADPGFERRTVRSCRCRLPELAAQRVVRSLPHERAGPDSAKDGIAVEDHRLHLRLGPANQVLSRHPALLARQELPTLTRSARALASSRVIRGHSRTLAHPERTYARRRSQRRMRPVASGTTRPTPPDGFKTAPTSVDPPASCQAPSESRAKDGPPSKLIVCPPP